MCRTNVWRQMATICTLYESADHAYRYPLKLYTREQTFLPVPSSDARAPRKRLKRRRKRVRRKLAAPGRRPEVRKGSFIPNLRPALGARFGRGRSSGPTERVLFGRGQRRRDYYLKRKRGFAFPVTPRNQAGGGNEIGRGRGWNATGSPLA